jgi:hypothetical protein
MPDKLPAVPRAEPRLLAPDPGPLRFLTTVVAPFFNVSNKFAILVSFIHYLVDKIKCVVYNITTRIIT